MLSLSFDYVGGQAISRQDSGLNYSKILNGFAIGDFRTIQTAATTNFERKIRRDWLLSAVQLQARVLSRSGW